MILAGIDPGLNGGISIIKVPNKIDPTKLSEIYQNAVVYSLPNQKIKLHLSTKTGKSSSQSRINIELLKKYITNHKVTHCYLEYQQARPNQSSISTATTFLNYGILWSLLKVLGVCTNEISPIQWQVIFTLEPFRSLLSKANATGKDRAITIAKVNNINLKPTKRSKQDNDGLADAFCISLYGLFKELNYL
jgi:hypothetical protein